MDAVTRRVSLIAEDLGRLRRMGTANHVLDRLCDHAESLDAMVRPTAADHYRRGMTVKDALATVDAEQAQIRRQLRRKA